MTRYQLWDGGRDPSSGHFVVNGVDKAAGTMADALQIRAFDGLAWSAGDNAAWSPFTVSQPVNHAPSVVTADRVMGRGATQALSSLLVSVSDPDGDTITKYQLRDSNRDPSSGHFVVGGVAQAAGTVIEITAAQFASTTFVSGIVPDRLEVRAFDGQTWSAGDNASWSPFTVTVPANTPPVVTTVDKSATPGQSLTLSSLFSVSDADGDTMTRYQLWDSTRSSASGHFVVNGADQAAGTIIEITAADLAQTSFLAGTVSDSLEIRAFDGFAWSAGDTVPWAPFHVNV